MSKIINLYNNVWVGDTKPVFIIAEIGSNHNQSLELAKESIIAAKDSGADAVKFQSINVDELYLSPSESTKELHKRIDFDETWHYSLKEFCDKQNIAFFSSPTYLKSIDILEEINVPFYKLASAQIGTFPQLVKKVAETGKPVILSTGIVLLSELDNVIKTFKECGNDKFMILHCNSIYPTPFNNLYLDMMKEYSDRYHCITGYSDHTIGHRVAAIAVAKGAQIIEKHFTLNKKLPVPDASFSLTPAEFKQMVDDIRFTENIIDSTHKEKLEVEESNFKQNILYRIVINTDKKKGDTLQESDFIYKRNPTGIDCRDAFQVFGKRINCDLKVGELLENKHLES